MSGFDVRFLIPIIINLLKFPSKALPWDWDAFDIVLNPNQISWTKICFHVFLILVSSFTSTTFSLAPPPSNAARIRFQFGYFSPQMALSLLCSLFFPQALFWFVYPAILIMSHFLGWVNLKLCGAILPVWNLQISSTLSLHHEEANIHIDVESQVPVPPQVSIDISPQDNISLVEG